MLIKDIMKENVVTVTPNDSVREAAKKMIKRRVGCLLVTENGNLKGIVTEKDFVSCLAVMKDPDSTKVNAIMIKDVAISTPYEDIFHGANMMAAKGIKRLPIINKGKLKGILSVSDLAPILNKEVERITSFIWSKNLSSKK